MKDSEFASELKAQCVLRFRENYPRIERCFKDLSEDQVWHRPNNSSNSIANLILHLSGNISQYIISSLGHAADTRRRDREFNSRSSHTKAELLGLLERTCNDAEEVISNCTESDLLRQRSVQGFDLSGIGIIIHVVEHFSYHTGQIAFYTKELLDRDLAFYGDMDLNVTNKD